LGWEGARKGLFFVRRIVNESWAENADSDFGKKEKLSTSDHQGETVSLKRGGSSLVESSICTVEGKGPRESDDDLGSSGTRKH